MMDSLIKKKIKINPTELQVSVFLFRFFLAKVHMREVSLLPNKSPRDFCQKTLFATMHIKNDKDKEVSIVQSSSGVFN